MFYILMPNTAISDRISFCTSLYLLGSAAALINSKKVCFVSKQTLHLHPPPNNRNRYNLYTIIL